MAQKKSTLIRANAEEKQILKELCLELSALQKDKVTTPEVLRRTLRIPIVRDILKEDAKIKRMFK